MEATDILKMNKESWELSAERFFGRTALPEDGPFFSNEKQLKLFGTISGQKVEIGCGSGHSFTIYGC